MEFSHGCRKYSVFMSRAEQSGSAGLFTCFLTVELRLWLTHRIKKDQSSNRKEKEKMGTE